MTTTSPAIVAPAQPVASAPSPSATILTALDARGTPPVPSELSAKMLEASWLFLAGKSYVEIASELGICRQTATIYVSKAKQEAAEQCESQRAINHITDSLFRLAAMRDRALKASHAAGSEAAAIMWQAEARKCEQQINKLKLKTSIIPSDDPEKLYQTPASNKPHGQRNDDPITDHRPRSELIGEIIEKMQRTRILQ